MNETPQRIERIKSIFLETQLFHAKHNDIGSLIQFLEKIESGFRSIGYESASMAIALKDLANNSIEAWLSYANGARLHKAQVYVGLGMAAAKLNLPFLSVIEKVEKAWYHLIADGWVIMIVLSDPGR